MLPATPLRYYRHKRRLKGILVVIGISTLIFVVGGVLALNTQLGLFRGDARSLADEHGCDAKNSEIWCGNCNSCKKAWDGCNCPSGGGSSGGGSTSTSGSSGGGGCKGASNCKVTCPDGAHFEDACPASGAFGSCGQWATQACSSHGGGSGTGSGGTSGGTTGGGSTKGLPNGQSSGCCGGDGECVGWFGAGSTCSNSNGACASGKQCKGGATATACGQSCGPGDCGRVICQGTSAQQTCNSGCKPVCGNGVCENTETYGNCPADCNPSVGGADIPTGGSYCSTGVVNGTTVKIEGICNLTKLTCNQWFAEKAKNPNVDCSAGLATGTGSACSSSSDNKCSGKKVGEVCGTDLGYYCDGIYSTGSGYWCTCRGSTVSTTAPAGTKCAGGSDNACSGSDMGIGSSCNYSLYHPNESYPGHTQCKQTGGTATAPTCGCRADSWSASATPTPTPLCQTKSKCETLEGGSCVPEAARPSCYVPVSGTNASDIKGGGGCGSLCNWTQSGQCASGLACTGNGVCRNDKCLEKTNCVCDPKPTATAVPTPGACNQICSSTIPCGGGLSCGGDNRCHNSSCKYGQDNSCNCYPSATTVTCPASPTSCKTGWHLTSLNFVANPNCDIKTCTPDVTVTATAAPIAPTCVAPTHCSTGLVETSYTDSKNCQQYKCTSGVTPTPSICPAIIVPVCNLAIQIQKYKTVGGCIVGDGCADIPCNANNKPVSDGSATWTCNGGTWVAQYNPASGQPKTSTQQPSQMAANDTQNQCNRVGDVYTGPGKKLVCNSSHQWVEPYGPNPTIAPSVTSTPTNAPVPSVTTAPSNTPDYGGAGANSGNSGYSGHLDSGIEGVHKPTQSPNPTKASSPTPSSTVQPTKKITPTLPPPGTATAPTVTPR